MRLFDITSTEKGSYAAVKFDPTTVKALEAYQYDNQIPVPLAADEFHSTVMFSQKYVPEFKTLGAIPEWQGMFTQWDIFPSDDEQALVLKFECHELTERFQEIMDEYDATWDHDDFHPHITLSYNVGDLDISKLPKYDGPIIIIEEYNNDLDLGWSEERK